MHPNWIRRREIPESLSAQTTTHHSEDAVAYKIILLTIIINGEHIDSSPVPKRPKAFDKALVRKWLEQPAPLLQQIVFVSENPKVNHRHFLIDDEPAQLHHIHYRSHDAVILDLVVPSTISKLTWLLCESRSHPTLAVPRLIPKSTKAGVDPPQR